MFKKIVDWFIFSSVNPDKFALTLKGLIPLLLLVGFSDQDSLNLVTDSIKEIVVLVGEMIAGFVTVYGLVRKVITTIKA